MFFCVFGFQGATLATTAEQGDPDFLFGPYAQSSLGLGRI